MKTLISENKPRRLVPWLVMASDLRRYFGRACKQCLRGRVMLFYYKLQPGPQGGSRCLFCLISATGSDMRPAALQDFRQGRFRFMRLSELRGKTLSSH
jgi:hypothetical protein